MPWYGWLLVALFFLLALVAISLRALRASRRGHRFTSLSVRAKLSFGRALLADPDVPLPAKLLLGVAVGYLALPFDLIPDFIPVVGQMDDALVLVAAVALLIWLVPRERFEAALDGAESDDAIRRADAARTVTPPGPPNS